MNYKCKCGSMDFFTEPQGNNIGLYCSMCGKWKKWLDKDEGFLFEHNKTVKKTEKRNNNTIKNKEDKEMKLSRDNYLDLIKIAEMFSEWLTKTSKELNMNEDDLQEIIKQFLS